MTDRMAALQVRPKAAHGLNLRSMSLLNRSSGIDYGMHASWLYPKCVTVHFC